MGEIAAASQEQTRGIEQVNQAITQMDQVTQQNAALVEEAAAAAQSMREQASTLVEAVSVFRVSADQEASKVISQARSASQSTVVASKKARGATRVIGRIKAAQALPQASAQALPAGGEAEAWTEF